MWSCTPRRSLPWWLNTIVKNAPFSRETLQLRLPSREALTW